MSRHDMSDILYLNGSPTNTVFMKTQSLYSLVFYFFIFSCSLLKASDLKIDNSILYWEGDQLFADIALSWNNSWHNDKNHDAVWVFAKFLNPGGGSIHAFLKQGGHTAVIMEGPQLEFEVPADGTGVFVSPAESSRGNIRTTLRVQIDLEKIDNPRRIRGMDFKTFGLEMVHIPEGGYTLGDPDPESHKFGGVFRSDANGQPNGLYQVQREDQVIEVGQSAGQLSYKFGNNNYEGDGKGPIPATFPKGVKAFYIMKYELTQGQYADFLNTLTSGMTMYRCMFGMKDYYKNRGTIYIKDGKYFAKAPQRPLNYVSWDDGMAYADWAGLRPMTELEFVKACRGPREPIAFGFPWGTNSRQGLQRINNSEGDLVLLNGLDESQLTDETLPAFGASYYWVMDLAGSIWERVITIGDSRGRSFTGQHGDGKISYYGFADVEDWPSGMLETEGFGFRGGGFYTHDRPYGEFNPYSPVAYRRFGGWPGGVRTESYGQRFVRTVN